MSVADAGGAAVEAGVVEPLLVVVINLPARPGGPDDLRHRIGELSEARFAFTCGLLGELTLSDVEHHARQSHRVLEAQMVYLEAGPWQACCLGGRR